MSEKADDVEGGIVRCGCGRAVPCRHCPTTPTPIDPADIRSGDVVEARRRSTVAYVNSVNVVDKGGLVIGPISSAVTWYLVSRPDPDAEAVEAIRSASYNILHAGERMDPLPGLPEARDLLTKLRERGWDVVRRAES